MTDIDPSGAPTAAWIGPETEDNELRRYAATIRHHGWLIVLTTVVAIAAAIIYVKTATSVYDASSHLLVTPVASGPTLPTPIPGVIPESSDPTRDVQTGANLVSSNSIAAAVKTALHLSATPAAILNKVSVQPVSDSDVVAITAQASNANDAAALANSFANQAVATRTTQFHQAVGAAIDGLKSQVASGAIAPAAVQAELAELETLKAGSLPDMRVYATATPPTGRSSPRVKLTVAAGAVIGLVLGLLGAFGLEALDTTLRREEQLKRLFRLPILARVPREDQPGGRRLGRLLRRGREHPRTPESLSPPALEAYRTLRAMALASRSVLSDPPRSFLVTSASPNEGKTTTALNLAVSLTGSGSSVILVEGDLRRPALGETLGMQSRYDLSSVLTGEADLERALVTSDRHPGVSFLLARNNSEMVSGDPLFLPTVSLMLDEAERLADYVVVDSPPLLAVIDALALAREVDFVMLVVRLGQTHVGRLQALGSLLAEAYIEPGGIAVIGAELPGSRTEYAYEYTGAFARGGGPQRVASPDEMDDGQPDRSRTTVGNSRRSASTRGTGRARSRPD
jgi:Mrp family chromosome partitioning ATPase/capsular polysaccharide biosynthesis protein